MLLRPDSRYGYSRASYELNLGCNYDCEHCYLGVKRFEGLDWPDRERLLLAMRDSGVVYLQLTGGEPLVDRLFKEVYAFAYDLGMLLSISTNGSRLWRDDVLDPVESAWSAVLALPPARFSRPLAEPDVPVSEYRALHGSFLRAVLRLSSREWGSCRPGSGIA